MNNYRFLIAGGNTTLLVKDCSPRKKISLAQKALDNGFAEQVGFIGLESGISTLSMMGDELCINATLAFAALTGKSSGSIKASGVNGIIKFTNQSGTTKIALNLNYQYLKNIVLFDSIGYFVTTRGIANNPKVFLNNLANKYDKPAFGIASLNGNNLSPVVYVKKLDSLTEETSCGSGSIAAYLTTNTSDIIQTTGKTIKVQGNGNRFTVQAEIVKI